MYTQLFGHYLLTNNIIDADELHAALTAVSRIKVKLGAIAIDSGYMSAEQVDEVHELQHTHDRRFGDIAVEKGFMTEAQVRELLSKQRNSNLILGQALIDFGFLSNKQFEEALADYKKSSTFTTSGSDEENMEAEMIHILGINSMEDSDFYASYVLLFVRNLIRFLGDDFSLGAVMRNVTVSMEYASIQEISGQQSAYIALGGDERGFIGIAARYAGENLMDPDDYTKACAGELLNLQNGLFAVNMSNDKNIELELLPQTSDEKLMVTVPENGIALNLNFSFGNIKLVVIKK